MERCEKTHAHLSVLCNSVTATSLYSVYGGTCYMSVYPGSEMENSLRAKSTKACEENSHR